MNDNGKAKFTSSPVTQGSDISKAGTSTMAPPSEITSNPAGEVSAAIPTEQAPKPAINPDPLKQRIHQHPPRNWFKRFIWDLTAKPDPTPEQIALAAERERRKTLEAVLKSEALLFKQRIINALDRRGLCYRYKKSERDLLVSGIQSIKFDRIVMQPDAIYLRLNTLRLPRGVSILALMDEDILTDLSLACGRRVSGEFSEKTGAWFIVERATGVLGIPSHVKFKDMLENIPQSADGLTIPLGVRTNSTPVYKSLDKMYSMLIGGTIGSGKSNMLNTIICTLIYRNPPERLKLLMTDLKGGLEFSFYEGIPHLYPIPEIAPHGIAYSREQVPELLGWLLAEGERRIKVIKAAGCKDIGRFNQQHRKKAMPHFIYICDEYADIKIEPKLGRQAEDLLTNIAQRFRAVGIHVILCTQIPKSEIVSTRIKGVLPAKLAFSVPTNQSSMAVLDNGHAKELKPAGRAIFQWGEETQLQTPFISDQIVRDIVEAAKGGHGFEGVTMGGHDVTPLEVMTWALEYDQGYLSIREVFSKFGARGMPRAEIQSWLTEWEGQEFIIGTSLYRVEPPAGSRPRRLIAVMDVIDENK